MLSVDNEKLINECLDDLIKKDNNINISKLKLRLWDYINYIAKENQDELTTETIKEIVSKIANLKTIEDAKPHIKYDWFLNSIVDNDLCAKCGSCSIVCPNNLIGFDEKPFLNEECLRKGNGMCKEVCPRIISGSYDIRTRLNLSEEYYYGSTNVKGQSGGVVTKFLQILLDLGEIDGAVVIGSSHWKPASMIITSSKDLTDINKSTKKSKYSVSSLNAVREVGEMGLEKIAVVGLPCQIAGLRNLQYHSIISKHEAERGKNGKAAKLPKIEYLLGLFCTEKFGHDEILDKLEVDIDKVKKFDVNGPYFKAYTDDEEYKIKLSDINPSPGCLMCRDFDAELADISFGEKGSPKGYTTVVIRSEKGKRIKDLMNLYTGVDLERIDFMKSFKNKRFNKEVLKRAREKAFNSFYYIWGHGGVGMGRKGKAYVRFRTPIGGYYDADTLIRISEVAKKYNGIIKLTSREEIEIQNVALNQVEDLLEDVKDEDLINGTEGPLVRSIMSCPGKERCLLGLINTNEIASKIEEKYAEKPANYKFKIGITGCPNKCLGVDTVDFGLHGVKTPKTNDDCNGCGCCQDVCKVEAIEIRGDTAITNYELCVDCGKCIKACPNNAKDLKSKGYNLYIGGKGGRETVIGYPVFVEDEQEIYDTLDAVFEVYNKLSKKPQRERLATTIKRVTPIKFFNEVEKLKMGK